ncbi:MAG TPA: SGNH/GDSL hydrolase family protein [Pseudolabrys sp.]|nr:SGNH/GDSL hydrolase family protein [Pseudolabrys sp.]
MPTDQQYSALAARFALLRVSWLPLLVLALFVFCSSAYAQKIVDFSDPSKACLTFKKGLSLGAPLPRVKAKLQTGQILTVVALGSSSTTGFGTFGPNDAFPQVMKQELLRLRPSARIEATISARIMENIPDNIARLDEILRQKPDLVVWQLGTNDVVWRGIPNNTKEVISGAVKRLKAAQSDIVLVDLQYAPLVNATSRHIQMEQIIADVAREQNVGLFPRFLLMKRAIEAGVGGLIWWDGLHNSAEGHKCIGLALAQMIDAATR